MSELRSNKRIADQIERLLSSGRAAHAFLFVGGSADSRYELGSWLAERILCESELDRQRFEHGNCPDLLIVEKAEDHESILKEQILEMTEKLSFKPLGKAYAVIIKDAHLMNETSQNKLLKTLEEPISETMMILLSESKDAIKETVRSRCSTFFLEEAESNCSEQSMAAAASFAKHILSGPCYYKKKNEITYILKDKDNIKALSLEFLDALEDELEKYILEGSSAAGNALLAVNTARMYIKQGQSAAYSMKQLCLRV